MTALTNRSSTGMTAVSSSSGLDIFPGHNFPPSQGYSPPQPHASSSPSPYSYSSAHATSTAHINRSHSSLPSRQSHNNSNYNNTDQGQPPSRHSTPATKPPSKQLEQLSGTHPPQHQISETSRAKNGHSPTAQKQISVSQVHGHAQDVHAQTQTQCCAPQPKARFLERSYTQKYQPNKILRNLSARFGSSTDTLPVVEAETVAQEYARTIKALWRMVEEEELSQRMADATPAEREWIILHNTTFPFTDVTMSHRGDSINSTSTYPSRHRFPQGVHPKRNNFSSSPRNPIYNNPNTFHDSKIHLEDYASNYDAPTYRPPNSSNHYNTNHDHLHTRHHHRFSSGTANTSTSVGPEDASSFHGEYQDHHHNNNRFTLLSEMSSTTVSTEAMNRELRSRSQDWYQQQLQEHGYQGYTNSYVSHRFHQPHAGFELESTPLACIEDDESSEDEYVARERKRKELEELEQELNVLGLQRYSNGPYCYQEGEMGELSGGDHHLYDEEPFDDDEGVIGVARKVPIRDSLRL
ncbi:hypothetical protein BGZ92_005052 [Podila epicladia]|nr:hypothetical protein BGZ92_005052 [Podila epicladia]